MIRAAVEASGDCRFGVPVLAWIIRRAVSIVEALCPRLQARLVSTIEPDTFRIGDIAVLEELVGGSR